MKGRSREAAWVPWQALRHLLADHGLNHAAAVAYFSLLSLPPFVFLLTRGLRALLPALGPDAGAWEAAEAFVPPAIAPILRALPESLPRGDGLVLVAVPALAWVASSAFSALEIAINVAFETIPQRRFWLGRFKSFAAASAAAVVLLFTALMTHAVRWIEGYRARAGLPRALGPLPAWLAYAGFLGAGFATLTLFYKVLPRGRVGWRAAGISAGSALVLVEGARNLFGGILLRSPSYGLVSGTLSGIVAFLLWVYTAVVITLYGAEIAAILNGNRPRG